MKLLKLVMLCMLLCSLLGISAVRYAYSERFTKTRIDVVYRKQALKDIDEETIKAISSVKVLQKAGAMKISINMEGKDNEAPIEHIQEQTIEFKTNDKVKALELLGKHLGMFNDINVNMKNAVQVELIDDVSE